jgi:hypothetical protein
MLIADGERQVKPDILPRLPSSQVDHCGCGRRRHPAECQSETERAGVGDAVTARAKRILIKAEPELR